MFQGIFFTDCLHCEELFTASVKCSGQNMRAIIHWRLLPGPLSTNFFLGRVKFWAVFLECQGPVLCWFKDKGPEKSWRSQIPRHYSVTQKTVLRSISAVAGVSWKHSGGGEDTEQDLWTASSFPGRSFPKVTEPIHTPIYIDQHSPQLFMHQEFCLEPPP